MAEKEMMGAVAQQGVGSMSARPSALGLSAVRSPRDVATGQSSGRTLAHDDWQAQDGVASDDLDSDSESSAESRVQNPREAGSGQSSGKRISSDGGTTGEDDWDEQIAREASTGQSTGKRQKLWNASNFRTGEQPGDPGSVIIEGVQDADTNDAAINNLHSNIKNL